LTILRVHQAGASASETVKYRKHLCTEKKSCLLTAHLVWNACWRKIYLVRGQCELQVGWKLVSYVNVTRQINVHAQQLLARNWQLMVGINDLRALTDPGLLQLPLLFIGLVTAVVYRSLQVTSLVWRFYACMSEGMPSAYKISSIAAFWIRYILTLRCPLAVSEGLPFWLQERNWIFQGGYLH